MTPKFLYFDLGNVLIAFSHERMMRQMAQAAGVSEEEVRRALTTESAPRTSLHWRLERGDISKDQFYEELAAALPRPFERPAMNLAVCDIFAPIAASLALVSRLKAAGNRLGILSNTNAPQWGFLNDGRFPELNEAFELKITSFEARSLKPDAGIYQHAARLAGFSPGELFFTDDRDDNVEGAIAAGLDAVRFESTEQLESELKKRGIAW